ncbi:alpha/beta fold hydrolase, partial [bacterium]
SSTTTDVSVYDRLVWPEGELESLLVSGERRRELLAYFGPDEYAALVPLARAAAAADFDSSRIVYLVPGIMGSQLGAARPPPLPADLLWIDPVDFQHGGLLRLALEADVGGDADIEACGPVVYNHLRLKLALAAEGFVVRTFAYDWRRGVLELGRRLAARLAADGSPRCAIVGHSMGGLVARAALLHAGERIDRIVTVGTPHAGSFATLQALRGVHGTVRRLAQLDPRHTAEALATRVFAGFPSLYDLLPRASRVDWFDASSWPTAGPQPRHAELARAATLELPRDPERIACIVGCGEATVTDAEHVDAQLRYHFTRAGDGTVPLASALLEGHATHYVPLLHGELPRDARVARAVCDLLSSGTTSALPHHPPRLGTGDLVLDEQSMREQYNDKLDWQHLAPEQRHAWLDGLNAPARLALA